MSETADVTIIGAGVIGAAIAYELAKRGHRTLSIDALSGPSARPDVQLLRDRPLPLLDPERRCDGVRGLLLLGALGGLPGRPRRGGHGRLPAVRHGGHEEPLRPSPQVPAAVPRAGRRVRGMGRRRAATARAGPGCARVLAAAPTRGSRLLARARRTSWRAPSIRPAPATSTIPSWPATTSPLRRRRSGRASATASSVTAVLQDAGRATGVELATASGSPARS